MTSLTEKQRELLKDLLAETQEQPAGINALRFRVKHEEHRSDLDLLERNHFIDRKDNKYRVTLLALVELRDESPDADHVICLCEKIFDVLRHIYRSDPERQIPIVELASRAQLSDSDVRVALAHMFGLPIWRAYSTDLNLNNAFVVPSEDILNYKLFSDVIDQLRRWSSQSGNISSQQIREKHQKFGIIDSPNLLASDLAKPCGALGRAVIYLDLDDFKPINTSLTETVVDELILPRLHRLLASCVENVGYAYGEGGDEFTILLLNSSEIMATAFSETIRTRIQECQFDGAASHIHISASLGISLGTAEDDGKELLRRANVAKNYAKEYGKNCVAIWGQGQCHIVENKHEKIKLSVQAAVRTDPKKSGQRLSGLSAAARELLIEVAKDPHGKLLSYATLAGFHIQTNDREFVESGNPRSEARWRAAVEELLDLGFLKSEGFKGEFYSITAAGYEAADLLEKEKK